MTQNAYTFDVVAGILWRDAQMLVSQRPHGNTHAGLWEFPGGKIEPHESTEQALRRELHEELGVQVFDAEFWRAVEHVYKVPARKVCIHFYHVHAFSGEPHGREGQLVRWVNLDEALQLPFLQADIPIVQALHQVRYSK